MKIDVFSAWGVGPDVGFNIIRTPLDIAAYPGKLIPMDFTAAEARTLAAQLIAAADLADADARAYDEYMKELNQ